MRQSKTSSDYLEWGRIMPCPCGAVCADKAIY